MSLGSLLNGMLMYVVVVVVQLRGVEVFTFTQGKGVTLLFMYSSYYVYPCLETVR